MASPETQYTSTIIQIEQVIFKNIKVCKMYIHATIMNMKNNMEEPAGGQVGEKKQLYYNLKNIKAKQK